MTAFADMAKPSPLLREHEGEMWFHCPGCDKPHGVGVADPARGPRWEYDGNAAAPTFSPSILVTWPGLTKRCHSFVRGGRIEFCGDSTHALAGQTVDLPEFPL